MGAGMPFKALALFILAGLLLPLETQAQQTFTAQQIANMSGVVPKREVGQRVVQGPTMTDKDVGKDGVGYVVWGYMNGSIPVFRLVALMFTKEIDVTSVVFDDLGVRPNFRVPEGAGNIQIDFDGNVYDHAVRNGLTVTLAGAETLTFTIPPEYFLGHYARWRATYD